jgi:HD-GYP domain-containing protein (c-di-GMP phosphodiesterase class II)
VGYFFKDRINTDSDYPANRAKTDAEREQLIAQTDLTLTEKLADAIEKNQPERVNAIAMILAKRLGYSDYQKYLQDIRQPERRHRQTIDVPVNY